MVATVGVNCLRHEQQMEVLGNFGLLGEAGVGEGGATSTTLVIGCRHDRISAGQSFEILLVPNEA